MNLLKSDNGRISVGYENIARLPETSKARAGNNTTNKNGHQHAQASTMQIARIFCHTESHRTQAHKYKLKLSLANTIRIIWEVFF